LYSVRSFGVNLRSESAASCSALIASRNDTDLRSSPTKNVGGLVASGTKLMFVSPDPPVTPELPRYR